MSLLVLDPRSCIGRLTASFSGWRPVLSLRVEAVRPSAANGCWAGVIWLQPFAIKSGSQRSDEFVSGYTSLLENTRQRTRL